MRLLQHRIPPPLVGALVAAAMWAVADWGPAFAWPALPRNVAAGALAAAGVAFDLLGLLAFRAARTTVNPMRPERASALVTGGIYRVTRNPMYTGMALLLAGWALCLSALLPFAGQVAFVLYISRFQIAPEERVLERLFGEEFLAYKRRVRRWL